MTLPDLIAALEKAEGPSLQLDGMIWCAANKYEFVMWDGAGCVYRDPAAPKWDGGIKHAQASIVRPYSASIDAAVALVERVLPGYGWDLASNTSHIKACLDPEFGKPIGKHPHWAAVSNISSKKFEDGANPAVALCLATLRALSSQEQRK